MGVEELKLILSTVKDVSGVAAWVAVLFACKGYFAIICGSAVGLYAIKVVYGLLRPLVVNHGIAGPLMARLGIIQYISDSERKYILELVEVGLAAVKKKEEVAS